MRIARLLQVRRARRAALGAPRAHYGAAPPSAAVPALAGCTRARSLPRLALVDRRRRLRGHAMLVLCYAPGIAEPAAIRLPIVERAVLERLSGRHARA